MPIHIQKVNLIAPFIIEILLIYHAEVWLCPIMSDHTQLILLNQVATSVDIYPHTKKPL